MTVTDLNRPNSLSERAQALLGHYGDGTDGSSPTAMQWEAILGRDPDRPITLINFFKLRGGAAYDPSAQLSGTGQDAFDRYAAVSMPALADAGGEFLLVAPFGGMFAGENEDWDVIAIGAYPDTRSLLNLFENADYQAAFFHRTAACERQKVLIANA